MAKFAE